MRNLTETYQTEFKYISYAFICLCLIGFFLNALIFIIPHVRFSDSIIYLNILGIFYMAPILWIILFIKRKDFKLKKLLKSLLIIYIYWSGLVGCLVLETGILPEKENIEIIDEHSNETLATESVFQNKKIVFISILILIAWLIIILTLNLFRESYSSFP